MILSFKHQFIFIKTKKTGGSSIEGYLSKFLGSNDLYKTNSINLKSHHEGLYNHVGLSEFLNTKYGKYWYEFFTFTAVRHPFERLISEFYWSDRSNHYNNNFEKFLKDHGKINSTNNHWLLGGGEFDKLIYHENYINDINTVLIYLNLPTVTQNNFPKLKTTERKDKRPWYEFMTQEQIDYFKKNYPREIEIHKKFGYKI